MWRLFLSLLPISFLLFNHTVTAQEFTELSEEIGILEGYGAYSIFDPSSYGGGISFSDFNQDGWDDLTIATKLGDPIHFYINNQGQSFTKITSILYCDCQSKQVLWADLDNDGDKDFFVTCYEEQNRIYENIGNLTMVDRTTTSGIIQETNSPSTTATMGDFDNDGLLDIYVGNYSNTGMNYYDRLYKNNGSFNFSDVTIVVGLPLEDGPSLASSFQDINHDLKPELYISIDKLSENEMFKNNGDGTFTDIGASSNSNIVVCAMNSSTGDIDNDGDLDLYVTNGPAGNVLLRNNNDETFTDITNSSGVSFNRIGWGTSFLDAENDGDLDMYVSNSFTVLNATNALFINDGAGVFTEPLLNSGGLGNDDLGQSYTNIKGDFDNDGLEDLAVSNTDGEQFKLWKNGDNSLNNWIKVDLEGVISNKDGIGSWITAYTDVDTFVRYTNLGDGYLGQNSDFTTIGVKHHDVLDSLIVEWPSGTIDRYEDVKINQFICIKEGTSETNPNPCPLAINYINQEDLNGVYKADLYLRSNGTVNTSSTLQANHFVELLAGFSVQYSNEFEIINEGCN